MAERLNMSLEIYTNLVMPHNQATFGRNGNTAKIVKSISNPINTSQKVAAVSRWDVIKTIIESVLRRL